MTTLTNKTAVILGGAGRIGSAVAKEFERHGATVVIADTKVGEEWDISNHENIGRVVAVHPDIFVDCSGYGSDWIDHSRGIMHCVGIVAREMAENAGGSIVLTSSIYGIHGPDFRRYRDTQMDCPPDYSFCKAGVIGMTKNLATRYARQGVRVNCVAPGGVDMEETNPLFKARYENGVPMGRMATPADLIGAYLYFASDASKYTTGQTLIVDGGLTSW